MPCPVSKATIERSPPETTKMSPRMMKNRQPSQAQSFPPSLHPQPSLPRNHRKRTPGRPPKRPIRKYPALARPEICFIIKHPFFVLPNVVYVGTSYVMQCNKSTTSPGWMRDVSQGASIMHKRHQLISDLILLRENSAHEYDGRYCPLYELTATGSPSRKR